MVGREYKTLFNASNYIFTKLETLFAIGDVYPSYFNNYYLTWIAINKTNVQTDDLCFKELNSKKLIDNEDLVTKHKLSGIDHFDQYYNIDSSPKKIKLNKSSNKLKIINMDNIFLNLLENNSYETISDNNFLNLFSNDLYTQQQYNNVINNTSTVEVGCINKQLVKAYREYCKIIASPDGNCLYNSVSLVLFGSQHFMKTLKLITAYTMVKHKSFFDSLVQRDLHVYNCNFYIEESL